MTSQLIITCNSCGARIPKNSDQCELCGWLVGQEDHDMTRDAGVSDKEVSPPGSVASSTDELVESTGDEQSSEKGVFCHMCGWENPAGARFCSSCGTRLQEIVKTKPAQLPDELKEIAPPSKVESDQPVIGEKSEIDEQETAISQPLQPMHIGMLVVTGMLVVATLYMITSFSRRAFPEVEPAPAQAQTETEATANNALSDALPADVADRIATLESEADALEGEAALLKKREIVSILESIDRPDKAATAQEEIAAISEAREDWFRAGHYFYDWMDTQAGELRFAAAQRAVDAYEKGLSMGSDDLNIRTALAMAYLNTTAPMQGVQQIRQVLDTDADHLQGNFYYGVMLMQINRLDQAKAQFERVKTLVGSDSPMYQQADMMLQNLASMN